MICIKCRIHLTAFLPIPAHGPIHGLNENSDSTKPWTSKKLAKSGPSSENLTIYAKFIHITDQGQNWEPSGFPDESNPHKWIFFLFA